MLTGVEWQEIETMKTIRLTARACCPTEHTWAAHPSPVDGLTDREDTTIMTEAFATPITMSLKLDELGKCPNCGHAASAVRFEATPGVMS